MEQSAAKIKTEFECPHFRYVEMLHEHQQTLSAIFNYIQLLDSLSKFCERKYFCEHFMNLLKKL